MKYVFSTILAGTLWGIISLFIKPLSNLGFSPMQIMFARSFISLILIGLFLLVKDKNGLKIKLKDLWMFIGTGIISLTFFSFCYFTSILNLGVSIAVILLYTSPIFVLILSVILFKEKINLIKILCLILTFAGCILVTGIATDKQISFVNILIGIGAGLGYGLYSIFSRYALSKYSSLTVTFYTFVFSSISLIPFCNILGFGEFFSINSFLLLIGISVLCTVLPYIFYTYGLSGLDNSKAAILVTIEPLVGGIVGFTIWGESITLPKIIGILLILISVILLGIKKDEKKY